MQVTFADAVNPLITSANQVATRNWNDNTGCATCISGDFVPQEGELGAISNPNFATSNVGIRYDPAVATGIFATSAINPIFKDAAGSPLPVGLIEGNAYQVVNQLAGVGIALLLGVVGTFVILKLVDLTIGLRVSEEEELAGLDATQHGEVAYIFESTAIVETEISHPPAPRGGIEDLLPNRVPLES